MIKNTLIKGKITEKMEDSVNKLLEEIGVD